MGGQIIDATIVSAPKQHNSREENETMALEEHNQLKNPEGLLVSGPD